VRGRAAAAVISLGLLVGCGSDNGEISFDSPPVADATIRTAPPSTPAPTIATTTSTPGPATAGRWVEAATNLAGFESECGNMSLVTTRPDRDVTIAGIALHGLWASTDGADEWSPLGEGGGSAEIVNRPTGMLFDPEHPDTYWESGIYNGGGVYRTDDGGATFQQLGDAAHIHAVSVDLTDPARATLLAGAHEQPRVLRSTDGGNAWTNVSGGLPEESGFASFPLVIDAQTHLLGTRDGHASGIFRTADGGATWQRVNDGGVSGLPMVSPTDGAIYWIRESGGGLLKSVDAGETWTVLASPYIVDDAANLVELPDGSFVTLGAGFLVMSQDRGQTWFPIGPRIPYTPSGLAFSAFRNAFYVWRSDCDLDGANPIRSDSILRLDLRG
jgi:photosystem II stability/assembly factor-like uncharacterized protein